MDIPAPSSLSAVCRQLADALKAGLDIGDAQVDVTLGHPGDAEPDQQGNHKLNLFFYRFEPSGFQSGALPGETWMIRAHCLITPFGVSGDNTSAGEVDLRLVGEVMRVFHETPERYLNVTQTQRFDKYDSRGRRYRTDEVETTQRFQIQAVFNPLGLEEINQLWSTQGDVAYRPSLGYEFALIPVLPAEPAVDAPRVGAFGLEVHADRDARYRPSREDDVVTGPQVGYHAIAADDPDWAPVICLIHRGRCVTAVDLLLGADEQKDFDPPVWLAGLPAEDEDRERIELHWEVWDRSYGWRYLGNARVRKGGGHSTRARPHGPVMDPAAIPPLDELLDMSAPRDGGRRIFHRPGQAMLYALRTYKGSAGADKAVRSNPVLITMHRGEG